MSSGSSSIRCRIEVRPAPSLAFAFFTLPLLLTTLVHAAGADLLLVVSFLLASSRLIEPVRLRLLLTERFAIQGLHFTQSGGWMLHLVGGEHLQARLTGQPRIFRFLCALEFVDARNAHYSLLLGRFNCSDDGLRSLNLLLRWSSQEDLFTDRNSLRPAS